MWPDVLRLWRSISTLVADLIAAAIKSATTVDIDRHNLKTSGHIKKTGTHAVKVSLAHNVVATVNLTVVSA